MENDNEALPEFFLAVIDLVTRAALSKDPAFNALATRVMNSPMLVSEQSRWDATSLDMGVSFALCHLTFANTRKAVQDLQPEANRVREWTNGLSRIERVSRGFMKARILEAKENASPAEEVRQPVLQDPRDRKSLHNHLLRAFEKE